LVHEKKTVMETGLKLNSQEISHVMKEETPFYKNTDKIFQGTPTKPGDTLTNSIPASSLKKVGVNTPLEETPRPGNKNKEEDDLSTEMRKEVEVENSNKIPLVKTTPPTETEIYPPTNHPTQYSCIQGELNSRFDSDTSEVSGDDSNHSPGPTPQRKPKPRTGLEETSDTSDASDKFSRHLSSNPENFGTKRDDNKTSVPTSSKTQQGRQEERDKEEIQEVQEIKGQVSEKEEKFIC